MHQLDTDKLYKDIIRKLHKVKKSQDYLAKKLGCSRIVFWQISTKKSISFKNFFKICEWLDKEPSNYIVLIPKKNKKL